MPRFPARGLFVTGTDTEVGKTYFCELLARTLVTAGYHVGVYKPAASGGWLEDGSVICDDAVRLWRAAGCADDLTRVCPQMFQAPVAPHVAARMENRQIDEALLVSGLEAWRNACDLVIVEGAGGYLSPLSPEKLVADVALEIGYPLLVVTANRLGTINQTLQTLVTTKNYGRGALVRGVVMNDGHAEGNDASLASNPTELARLMDVDLLAHLHWQQETLPERDWAALFSGE